MSCALNTAIAALSLVVLAIVTGRATKSALEDLRAKEALRLRGEAERSGATGAKSPEERTSCTPADAFSSCASDASIP